MEEVIANFFNYFSTDTNLITTLLFFTLIIITYSVFVYYFYMFLSKKDLIELNLNQYNKSEHIVATKLFAILFYILEYLIILPVLTLFWFATLSVFVLLMAKSLSLPAILLITAALVAAVRVISYLSENLSVEVAKLLPFTLLAISLTDPNFFSVNLLMERIVQIPSLLSQIPYYIIFIILVEIVMRFGSMFYNMFRFEDD